MMEENHFGQVIQSPLIMIPATAIPHTYYEEIVKSHLSIAHNFPGHKDIFQQKTAFFGKIWVKTQKKPPAA